MRRLFAFAGVALMLALALGSALALAPLGAPAQGAAHLAPASGCAYPSVQSEMGAASVGTSGSLAGFTPNQGDTLYVVLIAVSGSISSATIGDTSSNSWTAVGSGQTSGTIDTFAWTATSVASVSDTLTIGWGGANGYWSVTALDLSGSGDLTGIGTQAVLSGPTVTATNSACSLGLGFTFIAGTGSGFSTSSPPSGTAYVVKVPNPSGCNANNGCYLEADTEDFASASSESIAYTGYAPQYYEGTVAGWASLAPYPPPPAPTGLSVTSVGDTTVGLAWTNPSVTLTDSYVQVYTGGLCSGADLLHNESQGSAVTSATISSLSPDTVYSFSVTAYNSSGSSGESNCVGATTLFAPPNAPTNLSASTLSSYSIEVNWTAPNPSLGVVNYTIRWGTILGNFGPNATNAGTGTAMTLTGLPANTTLYFEVEAWTNGGNGTWSTSAHNTTFAAPAGGGFGLTLGVDLTEVFAALVGVWAILIIIIVATGRRKRRPRRRRH